MPTPASPTRTDPRPAGRLASAFARWSAMAAVLAATADVFGRAIVMPNLRPPVTTTELARLSSTHPRRAPCRFRVLAADDALSHGQHEPAEIATAKAPASFTRSSTTPRERRRTPMPASPRSSASIPRSKRCRATASCCRCTGKSPTRASTSSIANAFSSSARSRGSCATSRAAVVLEHITTAEAAAFVAAAPLHVAATITPQHLVYSRNALFEGGVRPHSIACRY